MDTELDVLVVGAHPDDAEIACGGIIAHYKKLGKKVGILDLTNGEPTPFGTIEKRMAEAKAAADILKVDIRVTLDIPNRSLENTLENRVKVADIFRKYRPNTIITHPSEDWHADHIAAHHLVNAAKFQAKLTKTDSSYPEYYPPRILYFDHSHIRMQRKIDFLVDISDSFEEKIAALQAYKSQFYENKKNMKIFDWIRNRAANLGFEIGVEYAEALICPTYFQIHDITKI
ncbi:Diacetylchitobiose deacetylase [Candidatus Lokiarchaeum ossiferum]|uniref:Diacetylchitobiose deacetylase n=1 Tax=Candidatus Lokiarchaeum ossiferum TaxID=2951803 RepID=A0ABY6HYT6_9ARCH|nr:Diacetylchitobiose deacetylase [Candidatus Lokiarchaeum sp. B-35]